MSKGSGSGGGGSSGWALVNEHGVAINNERFGSPGEAHSSAGSGRRFGEGKGQPVIVGRTVWTAQVGKDGKVQQ